jgi:hypothetical protein
VSACELDEMTSLRASTVNEKAKREQFIARSTWKPDETELSALVDTVQSEWESANICSPQLTSALFPTNFNDMKAVEYVSVAQTRLLSRLTLCIVGGISDNVVRAGV